ncbi:MAG: DUF1735 domain-containing protein [Odoribacteraceae bacterium]|jgi:hypothetical protein|nr:DUF1735 domain-containing protein [Odoribacteraceae bacterium]
MKRYIFTLVAIAALTSCYDDYVKDYDEQAIYFPYQTDVRSVVVGEGMQFRIGVNLAGVIDNKEERVVRFEVDPSLVNAATLADMKNHAFSYIKNLCAPIAALAELPANEYSLLVDGKPAGQTVIPAGAHLGAITVRVDSAAFLADPSRTSPRFVVPLRLTEVSSTTLLAGKETLVVGVRYENMLFGHYWHGGCVVVTDPSNTPVDTIDYPTTIPQADARVWSLATVGPRELHVNAVGDELSATTPQFKLTQEEDGTITVTALPGASYEVEADGESAFNRARLLQDRKIFLAYKYAKGGNIYHARDTLTFRNRIRDGVNEWQDENTLNY